MLCNCEERFGGGRRGSWVWDGCERWSAQQVAERLLGTSIRKLFPKYGYFNGVISSFDEEADFYFVRYEDGDEEELTLRELLPYLPKEMSRLLRDRV